MANDKLMSRIDSVIDEELRYDTDHITSDGWKFLENVAPVLIAEKIREDVDECDFGDLTVNDVKAYLNDVIHEYEQEHPNIRYYANN